jgi:hypothetical protein
MSGSRGSGFIAQVIAGQNLLSSVKSTFDNKYSTQVSNGGSLTIQSSNLDNQVLTLKAKLAKAKKISDTYDREYLDRMASSPSSSFWRSRGVSTLQDWVLLIFFSLYSFIAIGLVFIVFMMSDSPIFGTLITAGMGLAIGTMIVALIVRFA